MSLDQAHYKLLGCARKIVGYEEKPYTTQNVHVCKTGQWKKCSSLFHSIQNVTLSKTDTCFWTTLLFSRYSKGFLRSPSIHWIYVFYLWNLFFWFLTLAYFVTRLMYVIHIVFHQEFLFGFGGLCFRGCFQENLKWHCLESRWPQMASRPLFAPRCVKINVWLGSYEWKFWQGF